MLGGGGGGPDKDLFSHQHISWAGGRIQRGASGPDHPPLKKNIGFLCNACPDPLENHKATKPALNVGSSSPAGR